MKKMLYLCSTKTYSNMINKCIEITKLIGDFRLNADLRRLQLFMHLLNQANEQGELSFNASEYAKAYGIDRTAMSRLLGYMEENGYIAKKTINGKTRITICAYNYYVVVADTASAVSAKETQREESAV